MGAKKKLIEVTDDMAKWASLCTIAQAQVDTIRPIVEAYHQAILQAGNYLTPNGERITDHGRTWELRDDHAAELYGLYEEAAKAAGFDMPPEVCPLLLAQHYAGRCERLFLEAALPQLRTIGIKDIPYHPKHRQELVDLLMRLVGAEKRFLEGKDALVLASQTFVTERDIPLLIPRRAV